MSESEYYSGIDVAFPFVDPMTSGGRRVMMNFSPDLMYCRHLRHHGLSLVAPAITMMPVSYVYDNLMKLTFRQLPEAHGETWKIGSCTRVPLCVVRFIKQVVEEYG